MAQTGVWPLIRLQKNFENNFRYRVEVGAGFADLPGDAAVAPECRSRLAVRDPPIVPFAREIWLNGNPRLSEPEFRNLYEDDAKYHALRFRQKRVL